MSYVGQDFPPCDIREIRTFALDFSAILVPGEEIASAVWDLFLREGTDAAPSDHLLVAPEFTATMTTQQVDWSSGQNAYGNVYTLRCEVTTTAGNVYETVSECAMAVVYTAPLAPTSLAERIRYKLTFAAGAGPIATASVDGPPGTVDDVTVDEDGESIWWVIVWPWWVVTTETTITVTITRTNGDREVLTVPVEVVQPADVPPPNVGNACEGVYDVAPWDRINIA